MAIVDELIAVLGYDLKGKDELRQFNQGLDQAEKKAGAFAARLAAVGAAAATAFVAGMVKLGQSVIATGSEFEKLEATLVTIEGSSEKAKAALDWVQDFAKTTPYDLQQVAEGFVRLRAYGLDPMSGQLESIGNASSAMGKSLMQGVEAVADAAQGENERLKEFGIRAKVAGEQITYTWQHNGETLTKTVKKNGTEIVSALTEIFDSRFKGAMERQSKTWEGMVSNLGDSWTGFLKLIGEKGFYDEAKRRLQGVVDTVDAWTKDGKLDKAAAALSGFMVGALALGDDLWELSEPIRQVAADFASTASNIAISSADMIGSLTGIESKAANMVLAGGALALLSSRLRGLVLGAVTSRAGLIGAVLLGLNEIDGFLEGKDSLVGDLKVNFGDSWRAWLDNTVPATMQALEQVDQKLQEINSRGFLGWLGDVVLPKVQEGISDAQSGEMLKPPEPNTPGDWLNNLSGGRLLGPAPERDRAQPAPTGGGQPAPADKTSSTVEGGAFIKMLAGIERLEANLAKQDGAAVTEATINDNKQDNRDQSVTTTVNVGGVHVQQAAQAPAAVGQAIGNAAGQAATRQASRFEMGPSF